MQLNKKKELAARTLGVGKARIMFNASRLNEVKDAITKQDIRDLVSAGAIVIQDVHGRRRNMPGKRRRAGSIKRKVGNRKGDYIILTRKLRFYAAMLKKQGSITGEEYLKLRKEIKSKNFRSKSHMKERVDLMVKERGK